MKPALLSGLFAMILTGSLASPAQASGNNTHSWISLRAVEALPAGRLKEILSDPELEPILLNGSIFPDGGYVIEDSYGEMAHWEPFIDSYLEWIAASFDLPYTEGEAARHVAFLFGMASHGMADQVFDSQLMAMARIYDAANWSDELLDSFDTASDVFLVAATGLDLQFDPFVPAAELCAIYAEEHDYQVDVATLETAQEMLHRIVLSYPREVGLNDPDKVEEYRQQYPWAAGNMMEPLVPGSPASDALAVAAYWQSLWFRLHHQTGPDLVIATTPGDGAGGHPTDHTLIESQLVVVFGQGIDEATIGPDTVSVSSAAGDHEVEIDLWAGDDSNLLRLRPLVDWAADTEYTVTLQPGITTMGGETLATTFTYSFSTAASSGSPIPPGTDPTPFDGEPELGEKSGSGCQLGGEGSCWLALLLALGLARSPRSRDRATA